MIQSDDAAFMRGQHALMHACRDAESLSFVLRVHVVRAGEAASQRFLLTDVEAGREYRFASFTDVVEQLGLLLEATQPLSRNLTDV
jgi:hypothetical protein